MNFTVLVKGRQYDRTGVMYLGDTEVWRTSTAEPTPYGIRWVWLKDMTPFLSLWKERQIIIFDLENVVNDVYTGILNTTLTATFFKGPAQVGRQAPADRIIPITERTGSAGEPSQFTFPEQNATSTVSFPRNVNRAVFSVDVKGQGDEEFWWSNVPQSAVHTFEDEYGTYSGYSPWREVQILIDGQLAGVSWPFPVIYTGGVVPHLHRPIVGIQAFDLREQEIDITPWLPLLCDGNKHSFTIKIVGLVDDGTSSATLSSTTESSWYVTGKIFLWLDDEGSITSGIVGNASAGYPTIKFSQSITQNSSGGNETLDYNIAVSRSFSINSIVVTQYGQGIAKWSQSLSYSNIGRIYAKGYGNLNTFDITGSAEAIAPGITYSTSYSYPLFCNNTATYAPEGNLTLWAVLDQGLNLEVMGDAVFPTGLAAFATDYSPEYQGSVLNTWRNSTANYYRPADNSYSTGVGKTRQVFSFSGLVGDDAVPSAPTLLYYRDVSAYNDTITDDLVEVAEGPVCYSK
ncbi:hypothetical protein DL764_000137 [Monosporascus ibericus]|uniref:Peptide N-acetyl-beta-D-glucosaminyl asparaginase amidase A N-terminal domain-containing protein n=1 Tax=Monosporascus ibericus TaxID=155417 RepID=A0A4V1XCY0_9PEZI|nr:hypothetical protein DL764_000137 [Monosporascus ibericus]